MKKLLSILAFVMAAAAALTAQAAGTDTAPVAVHVTLTAACKITTPPGTITVAYTSLGAAVNANTPFGVTCSNGLSYSMALNTANANALGLSIPLAIRDSTDANDITGSQTAGASEANYIVKASVTAGQAGNCGTATCTDNSISRTLTISY
jgi:hypothetical protein